MSTEAPAKATPVAPAPAAAPAAAAPAKPVSPAIPAAQEASRPKSSTPPPPPAPVASANKPDNSLRDNLKKLSAEVFASDEAKAVAATAKPAETTLRTKEEKPDAGAAEKKAEAPAAPVAETKDRFADIAAPDGATEVTQKGWKALKEKANTEIASAERKLAEAQAQIEVYRKATPAEAADLAKLQTELKSAHDRLAILDVSATPDFHRQYVEPKKKALAEASQLIADNAIEGAPEVASLLNLPRAEFAKKVSELAKDMPAFDQGTFVTNMREAYRLEGEQKGALSKAGELQQQYRAQTAQRQKQAFEETYKMVEERMQPLEVPEGADDTEKASIASYNASLAGLRGEAEKNAFAALDEKGVASVATKAAALDFMAHNLIPRMQSRHESALKLISELTAELTAIKQAKSPGSFSGDAAPAARDISKGTFADAMAEAKRMSGGGA